MYLKSRSFGTFCYEFLKWEFQAGLRLAGNDVRSVMLEENVARAAGVNNCTTEEGLRRIIRDAGFRPAQRDTLYRQYFLNEKRLAEITKALCH